MQTGLLQGRNSMELARAVQKRFDVSRSDAERLMMTEMRRVRTEVAKQSYEQNGNTEYQFLALGARPCDKCLDIDGQVFPVKEMMPGVNAPPMHPRCECTTAPYWDEDKFQAWLDSGAAADGVPWEEFEENIVLAKSLASDNRDVYNKITERGTEPIRQGFSATGKYDLLGTYGKKIEPKEGYFDVLMHGTPTAVCFGGKIPNMGLRLLAKFVKKHPNYLGQNIRLLSCDTGNDSHLDKEEYCFAEEFANAMGVVVEAPDDKIYVNPDGTWFVGFFERKTELRRFVPNQRRRMR